MKGNDAKYPGSAPCTARSDSEDVAAAYDSGNLKSAYLGSPVGGGFRAQLQRARKLTPANGVRKAARVAVAVSMLLAGRGQAGLS